MNKKEELRENVNSIAELTKAYCLWIAHGCNNPICSDQAYGEAIDEVLYVHFEKVINRLVSLGKKLDAEEMETLDRLKLADFGGMKGIFVLTNYEYTSFGHFCPWCGKSEAKGPFTFDSK